MAVEEQKHRELSQVEWDLKKAERILQERQQQEHTINDSELKKEKKKARLEAAESDYAKKFKAASLASPTASPQIVVVAEGNS